jgi:hypothetical protein
VNPEEPEHPREPVSHEEAGGGRLTASAGGQKSVVPGLTELRLAVLGIVVTIGLTVGFGIPYSLPIKVLAGLVAFSGACAAIRFRRSQRWLMKLAKWLTRT